MSKKGRDITKEVLHYDPPKVAFYEYWATPFNYLEKKVGSLPLELIMNLMNYNEQRDTRYCMGYACSERLFNHSRKHYCNECYNSLREDGFFFCKKCMMPEDECFHCNDCGRLDCICQNCKGCGKYDQLCECDRHFNRYDRYNDYDNYRSYDDDGYY